MPLPVPPDATVETVEREGKCEIQVHLLPKEKGQQSNRSVEVRDKKRLRALQEVMAGVKGKMTIRNGRPVIIRHKTRWLNDGGSLYLCVNQSPHDPDSCSKSWVFRYALPGQTVVSKNGKERPRQRYMGLGSFNTLTLDEAREKARECRKMLLEGIDPLVAKQGKAAEAKVAELRVKTFNVVMDEFLLKKGANEGWSAVHARNWVQSLRDHISPIIGDVPLSSIDTQLAIKALADLFEKHPVTALRVRGRCGKIWDFGVFHGYVDSNVPCPFRWKGHLENRFSVPTEVKHLPALPFSKMPSFMAQLKAIDSPASLALQWSIRTATRTGEVLKARARDVDREQQLWTLPETNTKTKQRRVIPLSDAAMAILDKLGDRQPDERLFPIHPSAMLWVAKDIDSNITVHATARSTFRDWASECTEFPNEICEMALGHVVRGVEKAYRRGDLRDRRRRLMEAWSDYCDGVTVAPDVKVVPMRRG